MKKIISLLGSAFLAANAWAIDPSGSRVDFGESSMDIPTPVMLLGLIIATIGCFWIGNLKNEDGKKDSSAMIWFGILGVIGIIFLLGKIA